MLPSVIARQIEQGIRDFLKTTFSVSTPLFHKTLDLFLDEEPLFKGPYLSMGLPFHKGTRPNVFPEIRMTHPPYLHQEKAFENLGGPRKTSTLVATGTGSGKTECFLYPVLHHCWEHRGEPGIKAILIYPMNALATDQAKRVAELIAGSPELEGRIRGGLYVGQQESTPKKTMGPDFIITDKDILRKNPPDILLTNYKMLDYLLLRPQDAVMWEKNNPETLTFLVVDELHTFDGAQGTDLACLIRRLKHRLDTPEKSLCCVGTSATLGSESEAVGLLAYAEKIFGEPFTASSLIRESRETPGEFLGEAIIHYIHPPMRDRETLLDPESYTSKSDYLSNQYALWFDDAKRPDDLNNTSFRIELGKKLKQHLLFQNLVKALKGGILSFDDAWQEISRIIRDREAYSPYAERVMISLLSLVSLSLGENRQPLVQVRIQHWMRELGRMVVSTGKEPRLKFSDDLKDEARKTHLPVVHCRECGAMGWLGTKKKHEDVVGHELNAIYQNFFAQTNSQRFFIFPEDSDLKQSGLRGEKASFCGNCHRLSPKVTKGPCGHCGEDACVTVYIPEYHTTTCPYCYAHRSLTLLGSRAASLTSVMISQLYASPFNDDKKLITFSDNVQDAAHRAGFFGARTWGFNLRTAIQKAVTEATEDLTLADLPSFFTRFWKERFSETNYITTFIAPNMEWFHDYDHLIEKGVLPEKNDLVRQIDNRLHWEIFSEYGFDSRIGRTLEKSGCSIAHTLPDVLETACRELSMALKNEVEACRNLEITHVRRFILGMITTLRSQGGIEADYLKSYLENWGNQYLISQSKIRWMQNFGPNTRAPKFLTDRHDLKNQNGIVRFEGLYHPSRRTFLTVWAEKNLLPVSVLESAEIRAVLEIVVKTMTHCGVFNERKLNGGRVWGLRPEILGISRNVVQMRCNHCGHIQSVAGTDANEWDGAPCLRASCLGSYEPLSDTPDYYGKLYLCGDVERLFTREHTGLLDRDTRERIEKEFKAEPDKRQPWYPNLLSCTPTLEMGIDIGGLSATIQCSVPPGQAGYLQRIGRAGRKNGNALNLTLASLKPHDLYFFSDPFLMMAGKIDPPGVFLDAAAVLERQFTAFCFDRWVKKGVTPADLPQRLGTILDSIGSKKKKGFPFTLLDFIDIHQTVLFESFQGLFTKPSLSPSAVSNLTAFIKGDTEKDEGSLGFKIIDGLIRLSQERKALKSRIETLRKNISAKEASPAKSQDHDDMIREMKQEKNGLQELVKTMNGKNVFNFFTDEGLLPNYAFPEQGVTLHSIIYRYKKEVGEGGKKYDTTTYQYERAASSAIGELAPSNIFYAGGRKVTVDQIDLQVSQIETWRVCAECSHAEMAGTQPPSSVCPRCGSTMWPDAGRQLQMIRLRQVFATTPDDKSRIADDKDEREPRFYVKQLLMDYDPASVLEAYRLTAEDAVFGYEYLTKAVFREINFGNSDGEGPNFKVAGVENSRPGFGLCSSCGKVPDRNGKLQHSWTCKERNQDSQIHILTCAYLYREFSSEAVKILLPISGLEGSDVRLQSFIAALQLGLKKQFGGSIDHLRSMLHTEPVPDSNHRRQFLVIYDTVPGGTGYLKQLTGDSMLLDVLQVALNVILECPCATEPEKDGCYACLYGYRNSGSMSAISRKTAISMLTEILKDRDTLEKTPNLSNVSLGALFDSELETRFIETLRRQNKPGVQVTVNKEVVDASPGFLLSINGVRWRIAQQVLLDKNQGVTEPSRADFVFYPVRPEPDVKPVVVFTDGYAFHRHRIGKDMAQRMAIVRSRNFHVWSLTYKDVEDVFKEKNGYFDDWFAMGGMLSQRLRQQTWEGFMLGEESVLEDASSFKLFFRYLSKPRPLIWRKMAMIFNIGLLKEQQTETPSSWWTDLEKIPHDLADDILSRTGPCLGGGPDVRSFPFVDVYARTEVKALSKPDFTGAGILAVLDDGEHPIGTEGFESAWNGFLRAYNLFQFLPRTLFVSKAGLDDHAYETIKPTERVDSGSIHQESNASSIAWDELKELVHENIHPFIDFIRENNFPVPDAGSEVEKDGEVIGEMELAWHHQKIAVLKPSNAHLKPRLESDGWACFGLGDVLDDPTLVVTAFETT